MSTQTPPSPKTPHRKHLTWTQDASSSIIESPGCCSTPSTSKRGNGPFPSRKVLWEKRSPSKHTKLLGSPISKQSFNSEESKSHKSFQSTLKDSKSDVSINVSPHGHSGDPSWSQTFSSAESAGTVTVELDFPHGGWDEDSSDECSSCSLEIVESEAETHSSPVQRGRKRKQSEVSVEDNAILSGMGEEIERQLEAKAERNRLTVPNVKNILRSVITNPYVQAMVRRSIKSGEVAVSGDSDDVSFEPRMTRAKAKLLCDSNESNLAEVALAGPLKVPPTSEYQALINEEFNFDSDNDDEEYHPGEDEPSDNDFSERDGSERGSERDVSMEQSPFCCDTDNESLSATASPSPKPHITDSATQTNWSEDGVFKVPVVPPEPPSDHNTEENIALRTRSKLPLNDTPLEEIEQAFIPPDITPDLYDTTCDNEDWQEFLKEFMQPMRSEPEVQNHDDDDEDPEYNVLAEEEIIDKEELRMDRAVKVSKRELNELMRELLEFTENLSSDDDDSNAYKKQEATTNSTCLSSSTNANAMGSNEDMSLLIDAYMSLGTLTPLNVLKTTPPPSRSPGTPTLHTPVPPMSPPCRRTPGTGKKGVLSDVNANTEVSDFPKSNRGLPSASKGQFVCPPSGSSKKKIMQSTPGKSDSNLNLNASGNRSGKKERRGITLGKHESYPEAADNGKKLGINGKLDSYPITSGDSHSESKQPLPQHRGKLDSYPNSVCDSQGDSSLGLLYNETCDLETIGLIGANIIVPVTDSGCSSNYNHFSSPGKDLFLLTSRNDWEKTDGNTVNSCYPTVLEFQNTDDNNWSNSNVQIEICESSSGLAAGVEQHGACEPSSAQDDDDPEMSVSLALSSSPPSPVEANPDALIFSKDLRLNLNGDVIIDNTVVLSKAQRFVLNQQMRQYVQLLTQHFMQACEHPIYSHQAEISKKRLVDLDSLAGDREKSALRPANLSPALELVNSWAAKMASAEGTQIISFINQEMACAKHQRNRNTRYVEKFPPQFMNALADSKVVIYPELLPLIPFRTIEIHANLFLPSEDNLIAIGLEEFVGFIRENNTDKKIRCLRWAIVWITEYLLKGKCPDKVYTYLRRVRKNRQPLKYYFEHLCAPETKHIVKPFSEHKMTTLRETSLNLIPSVWRDFIIKGMNATSSG